MSETDYETLYGTPKGGATEDYESPEEYAGQGDTRVVRDLQFSYLAIVGQNPDGTPVLQPVDCPRDTELSIEEMGQLALEKGESNHSFYYDAELERLRATGTPAAPVTSAADVSALGAHELAEWLRSGKDGSAFSINEVMDKVGDDSDLAQRMLEAENIATDGDPRAGLEKGLTTIIERESQ